MNEEERRILEHVNAALKQRGLKQRSVFQIDGQLVLELGGGCTLRVFTARSIREVDVFRCEQAVGGGYVSWGRVVDRSDPFVGRGWLDRLTAKVVELVEKYGEESNEFV